MVNSMSRTVPIEENLSGARMLAVVLACVAGSLFGDVSVLLLQNDADAWKDGSVTMPSMSSFLQNHADYTKSGVDLTKYGWSDGGDPDPGKDYVVNKGRLLFTPYVNSTVDATALDATTYTFPGKTLTLDNGTIGFRSCNNNGTASVCIPNLIVKKGTLSCQSWSRKNRWSGTYTIDSSAAGYPSSALTFVINMTDCYIDAKLIATAPNQVAYVNGGLSPASDGAFRCVSRYRDYRYYLNGDCCEYYATNSVSLGAAVYLGPSETNGASFDLGVLGTLALNSAGPVKLGGNVRGRDAALVLPEESSLEIEGETDFGWADASDYTYAKSGCVATNVYTLLPASTPYEPSHAVSRKASCELNVINVGARATLTLNDAKLSATLFRLGEGATVVAKGCLSVDPKRPVELELPSGFDGEVLSYPVANGRLKIEDFVLASGSARGALSVVTRDGVQYLYALCLDVSQLDAEHGYVTMTEGDGTSASTYKTASFGEKGVSNGFDGANHWSDGEMPSPGKKYFTNGKTIRSNPPARIVAAFGGDCLVQDAMYRLSGGVTTRIDNWILLPNKTQGVNANLPQITTSGMRGITTVNGCATFFTTETCPFSFYGSYTELTWVLNLMFIGDSQSCVLFNGALNHNDETRDNFHSTLEYHGDASSYRGQVLLYTNLTCRISNGGFPYARFRQTDYTELETALENGNSEIVLGEYIPLDGAKAIPNEGTTLCAKRLSASGTLTKSGAGTLAVGGPAGSEGATLNVTEGALRADSAEALVGVNLRFAANATLAVRYSPESGASPVVEPASLTAPEGLKLAVDFDGQEVPNAAVVPVLTVDAATATALTGRISVTGRPKQHSIKLKTSPVVDNRVTYSVEIANSGLILVYR